MDFKDRIDDLNFIIAIVVFISCLVTIILTKMLNKDIRRINEDTVANTNSLMESLRIELKGGWEFYIILLGWGTILGFHWTYGTMFGVFFGNKGLSHRTVAVIGMYANITTIFLSNLGTGIHNVTHISRSLLILIFSLIGFMGSLHLLATSEINYPPLQSLISIISAVIITRIGLSAYVPLSLLELNNYGSSVLVSAIYCYIANISNLATTYLADGTSDKVSFIVMSACILLCILIV